MKKLAVALVSVVALVLAGCAQTMQEFQKFETTVSNAVGVVASTKINSRTAYIAINTFNAAERSVTNYLNLPPCTGAGTLCRVSGAAEALDQPFNSGIVARNNMRAFMIANKGSLADAGLYNTLKAATASLQSIMAIYGIGGSK